MFGMLDYRAHKLYWLIGLPLRLAARITFWLIVVGATLFAGTLSYSPAVKVVVAYVSAEAGGALNMLLFWAIGTLISSMFFWIIDVIPSKGEDAEEAQQVVKYGPLIWLGKKFDHDIENWTGEDTKVFTSYLNWRARWFFKARERTGIRVRIFQRVFRDTGRRPADFSREEIKKLVGHVDGNWLDRAIQTAIVSPYYFNSICAFAIITLVILEWQKAGS